MIGSLTKAAVAAALTSSPVAAHTYDAAVQQDTASVAEAAQPVGGTAGTVGAGSALSRDLARLGRGHRVEIEVPVEVIPPISLPARTYAEIYGISPDLAEQIVRTALEEGIDPDLGFRLVRTESVFRRHARGPRGALGLMQLMPSTARAIDGSVRTEEEILEPRTNLRLGFRYLRRMIEMFDGDLRLGLLAYNRGEGTVARALRAGRDPENGYSHRVLGTRGPDPYDGPGLVPTREG